MSFLAKHNVLLTMARKQLAYPFAASRAVELALIKYFYTPHPVFYWGRTRFLNESDVFCGFRSPDS
jgi:hypothetical protein